MTWAWQEESDFDDSWGDDAESRSEFADDGWGGEPGVLEEHINLWGRDSDEDAGNHDDFGDAFDGSDEGVQRFVDERAMQEYWEDEFNVEPITVQDDLADIMRSPQMEDFWEEGGEDWKQGYYMREEIDEGLRDGWLSEDEVREREPEYFEHDGPLDGDYQHAAWVKNHEHDEFWSDEAQEYMREQSEWADSLGDEGIDVHIGGSDIHEPDEPPDGWVEGSDGISLDLDESDEDFKKRMDTFLDGQEVETLDGDGESMSRDEDLIAMQEEVLEVQLENELSQAEQTDDSTNLPGDADDRKADDEDDSTGEGPDDNWRPPWMR